MGGGDRIRNPKLQNRDGSEGLIPVDFITATSEQFTSFLFLSEARNASSWAAFKASLYSLAVIHDDSVTYLVSSPSISPQRPRL
jgi:hypothetical protein